MYKCGWNGCEKAYGTLNHLNAHVTMQSHGAKRTPEGKYIFFSFLFLSLPFWLFIIIFLLPWNIMVHLPSGIETSQMPRFG